MQRVIDAFANHFDELIAKSIDRVYASNNALYEEVPPSVLTHAVTGAFQAVLEDLKHDTNVRFTALLTSSSEQRAQQGALPSQIISGYNIGFATASDFFRQYFANDYEGLAWWFERMHAIAQAAAIGLSDSMLAARENRLQAQASVIRELSSPLIPVYHGILVLPLVGTLDSYRAGQMMEIALQGIVDNQADVIILDVTGVPVVDTAVAQSLLQVARAVRLLGAEVMLVGIGAEIAQTMVQLGVNLSDIHTYANLQVGIEHALRRQRLAIQPLPSS